MAISIEQYIANFIKDAQYRIAELGVIIDEEGDFDSPVYKEAQSWTLQLHQYMEVLYVGEMNIIDGFNFLDWDDYSIKAEAEYLRNLTGMVTSPFITFVGEYPQIVESITGISEATGLPIGFQGQYVGYDANGNPIAEVFPLTAGMQDNDTVETFFI